MRNVIGPPPGDEDSDIQGGLHGTFERSSRTDAVVSVDCAWIEPVLSPGRMPASAKTGTGRTARRCRCISRPPIREAATDNQKGSYLRRRATERYGDTRTVVERNASGERTGGAAGAARAQHVLTPLGATHRSRSRILELWAVPADSVEHDDQGPPRGREHRDSDPRGRPSVCRGPALAPCPGRRPGALLHA